MFVRFTQHPLCYCYCYLNSHQRNATTSMTMASLLASGWCSVIFQSCTHLSASWAPVCVLVMMRCGQVQCWFTWVYDSHTLTWAEVNGAEFHSSRYQGNNTHLNRYTHTLSLTPVTHSVLQQNTPGKFHIFRFSLMLSHCTEGTELFHVQRCILFRYLPKPSL